jgi:glycosyltransferase involved in cell wall biosynthesis
MSLDHFREKIKAVHRMGSMKYSVLIPTRNRLEYLKYAIASVLKQNYDSWELIVSDNASTEDVGKYVRSLNEPRIKYSRSEKFLTVTESWNRCVDLCSGDYVIMLGDDDILLKGYFEITDQLLENHQQPELIYTNSYLYIYPGVLANFPKGTFQTFGALNGMPKCEEPFCLDLSTRLSIVQGTLRFCTPYSTNMQHVLIHRLLLERVKKENKFFHSPYPDIYVMSALFIEAQKVLIYPKEMVVVGVTPKSHGYYAFNNKQKEAVEFLNVSNEVASIPNMQHLLFPPYNSVQTLWLAAIHLLGHYFPLEKFGLEIDYKKYKKEQFKNFSRLYFSDKETFQVEYKQLMKRLPFAEKALNFYPNFMFIYMNRIAPKFIKTIYRKIRHLIKNETSISAPQANAMDTRFSNALEIFEQIDPR